MADFESIINRTVVNAPTGQDLVRISGPTITVADGDTYGFEIILPTGYVGVSGSVCPEDATKGLEQFGLPRKNSADEETYVLVVTNNSGDDMQVYPVVLAQRGTVDEGAPSENW